MKSYFKLFCIIITVFLTAYFVYYIFNNFNTQDFSQLTSISVLSTIFIASLLYSAIIPLSAFAWGLLLESYEESFRLSQLSTIMATTQFAKYIPGNVSQHFGRAALSLSMGMTFPNYLLTILLETGLAVLASITIGNIFMLITPGAAETLENVTTLPIRNIALCSTVATLSALLISPLILKKINIRSKSKYLPRKGLISIQISFIIYLVNYMLIGFGMWLIAREMNLSASISYALITSAFAWSWLAGFVTIGAPAGFGAREAVLVLLLTSSSTEENSLLAFILAMRLVTLVGDSLCFIIGTLGLAAQSNENRT